MNVMKRVEENIRGWNFQDKGMSRSGRKRERKRQTGE
jgi:hypothetical protein